MKHYFKLLFYAFILFSPYLISSCLRGTSINDTSGIYPSDFLIEEFNTFDEGIWNRLNDYVSFSELRSVNVFVSNGNLIFLIPNNSTTSGGISSKYRFPKGDFSTSFLKTNDNSVFSFTLYNSGNSIKLFVNLKNDGSSNLVEYGIESSYTNYTGTNYLPYSYSYHTIKISVFDNSAIYYFDNNQIWSLNSEFLPRELYVKILSYLQSFDNYFYDRFIYTEMFSYQKR